MPRLSRFCLLSAALFLVVLPATPRARAETCQAPDNVAWVSGTDHCFAIKTYPPQTGKSATLAVVLHGDLSGGGPADEVFFMAEEAAKAGAVAVAMMRPGYEGDGRRSTGIANRDQDRDDRFKADEMDSIAAAVKTLKAHYGARRVVLIGFSGGAIISGVLIGRAAPLVDGAVLLSCPCHVPDWRESNDWKPLYNAESPHAYVDRIPTNARIIALTGENDGNAKTRFAADYIKKATQRGINAVFVAIPNATHSLRQIKAQPQLVTAIHQIVAGN